MDEQDIARDRSVSPNYHSLIYGDTKRKIDSKVESFVNGAESHAAADSEEATLSEATSN